MKKFVGFLFTLVVIGLLLYASSFLITYLREDSVPELVQINDELIKKGEYIAKAADCYACHTVPGSKDFSGGLAMQTPVGAIYSTNITPDKETGIGHYTYSDFYNAVKNGVSKKGHALYPAMPYTSYTILKNEDVEALYAYFMKGVQPVSKHNQSSTLPFWMSMRWPVAYWQMLFAPKREFTPPSNADEAISRGEYLVEGTGHCGACHTPRGFAYQEKSYSLSDGDDYLTGAIVDGWRTKSLRGEGNGLGDWTVEQIQSFFKTGRTDNNFAFGAMSDVVQHSLQYLTDKDLNAMATYLKSLPPTKGRTTERPKKIDKTTENLLAGTDRSRGGLLYMEFCMTCHRPDGNGVKRIFPALNNNTAVVAHNPESVVQLMLEGSHSAHTPHDIMSFAMPKFDYLSDADIAILVNYIRNSWTNSAPQTSREKVSEMRAFLKNKASHYVGE
ncbi:cytochrome c [Taylorella equigenitalis]|uniref:cytochrome c n=1 Tax=Taylorella equigenitalis TaxID=29575 RepID=UPI0023AFF879|nr:cytochrome c [Taylorella equigenitalis]WEE00276.1 cytochrome c [Taylorella equigenitalis]WEE01753.1 cytochrome c [Taylorella equigenitalis]WFD78290.1 cytochrome c [Taylorella equigenitalis]WFD79768.1 cytochrome c [Taylorella equigenitalis]WFD81244.1 cytochrome c [Taylorella equigenitalis]